MLTGYPLGKAVVILSMTFLGSDYYSPFHYGLNQFFHVFDSFVLFGDCSLELVD